MRTLSKWMIGYLAVHYVAVAGCAAALNDARDATSIKTLVCEHAANMPATPEVLRARRACAVDAELREVFAVLAGDACRATEYPTTQ